ncbi:DNA double-strand break repair nuclease NurA [Methanococcus maripaludis]|uniref:NurA domain protein n=1 Tax=Methanococcus maripaludis TaxID=39152 RepID=A0A2L1CAP3_METMI|nr:DNA double-strand break repair nuclease NurA [Methanococcus maripaludis]AVB75946.1 NurA domain protein [Methanococcus maripaludis]
MASNKLENVKEYIKDPGKHKALVNHYLLISNELNDNKELLETLLNFNMNELPKAILSSTPLQLKNLKGGPLSDFPLEIKSCLKNNRVFTTQKELIKNLDLDKVTNLLKSEKIELIGIDESKVEIPRAGCLFAYLKSVAFRISLDNEKQIESIGPMVNKFRVTIKDEEDAEFEKESQLIGYLRNMFVAWVAIKNSLENGYKPIVFLHGPLVRAIGGFTDIVFEKDTLIDLFTISEDIDVNENSDFSISGKEIIKEFHENESKNWHKIYSKTIKRLNDPDYSGKDLWKQALPVDITEEDEPLKSFEEREYYPGISIYFWMLGKLYDVCKENKVPLTATVESISRSTEFLQYVLPTLLDKTPDILPEDIMEFEKGYDKIIKIRNDDGRKENFYRKTYGLLKNLNITDSVVTSYLLNESEYTTPIRTCRYQPRSMYLNALGHRELGIKDNYSPILEHYFKASNKIFFSYLKTTPLREPIRVEFFNIYDNYDEIIGLNYLFSLMYPDYGIPVMIFYADKIARTHKNYLQIILDSISYDMLVKGEFDIEKFLRFGNHFTRNFFER